MLVSGRGAGFRTWYFGTTFLQYDISTYQYITILLYYYITILVYIATFDIYINISMYHYTTISIDQCFNVSLYHYIKVSIYHINMFSRPRKKQSVIKPLFLVAWFRGTLLEKKYIYIYIYISPYTNVVPMFWKVDPNISAMKKTLVGYTTQLYRDRNKAL